MAEPVRPNLIGESFLLPIISGGRFRSQDERLGIVLRAYHRAGAGTVDTLIRCAQDLAEGHADHAAVQWLRTIIEASDDIIELMRIADFLPQNTLSLRELAVDIQGRIVAVLRVAADQQPDAFTPDLAMSLNNLANRLSALGRREEALAAAEDAVRLRRTLAATRPDAFTPDLAGSLNNLANRLSDLGRREEALAAAEDAVRHYRTLAATRPDAFTPDLAMSLSVLGDMLEALGRSLDAVSMDEEAVCLLRPYFLRQPTAFAEAILVYAQDYIRRCELAGREPDAALLEPIAEVLSDGHTDQ
ncbi:MAG: tetratricopeptide repeat protein [Rhodopila sp.]